MANSYSCDPLDIIADEMCQTELAGNGDQIYYLKRELVKDLDIDQHGNLNPDDFVAAVRGKVYQLDMHADTVQGTATVEDDQTAGQSQLTARADKGEQNFRQFDRTARYADFAYMAVSATGFLRLYYGQHKRNKYSSSYDTGTEYNSDHGFTITITAPATEYAYIGVDLAQQTGETKATISDLLHRNANNSNANNDGN
jgi:hypothetical protein